MKKKYLLGIIPLFIVGSVLAIWIVNISSTANYTITSSEYGGIEVTQNLTPQTFNSLSDGISMIDYFNFSNSGDLTNMNITIELSKQDEVDECNNYENDCDVYFKLDNSINLEEGSNIETIGTGDHYVSFNLSCVQYSCPQIVTPTITVEKIPN